VWSRGFRKYSSAVVSVSLTRNGYNAIANLANAVCITRTFAYACWLFSASSVKTLRPVSSISWIIFITRVSKTRILTSIQLSHFSRNDSSMKFMYVCDVRFTASFLCLSRLHTVRHEVVCMQYVCMQYTRTLLLCILQYVCMQYTRTLLFA